MSELISIVNDGPIITETNYWESGYNAQGVLFLSTNAGAFRLLLPDGMFDVGEMLTAKQVVVSVGPGMGKSLLFEVMFDDHSDSPYCIHFGTEQVDRIPGKEDNGKEFRFIVYERGLKSVMDTTCKFRFVSVVPCLKPWGKE